MVSVMRLTEISRQLSFSTTTYFKTGALIQFVLINSDPNIAHPASRKPKLGYRPMFRSCLKKYFRDFFQSSIIPVNFVRVIVDRNLQE